MKNPVTLLLFLAVFSFSSCIKSKDKNGNKEPKIEDFHTVSVNEEYQVSLPKFMKGTTGLNEEASLQYQNLFKEAYTIIIDEPKQDFVDVYKELDQYNEGITLLQNYRKIQLQAFTSTIQVNHQSEVKPMTIHGLDAESVEIDGHVEGIDEEISYFLTFVEGTENIYMIMAWTLKSKKEEHQKTFETIAQSFELLDQAAAAKV